MENEFSNRISVKNIVLAGMFAAFLAVMSQVSLPMPTGVPITVQVFAVALVGVILGIIINVAGYSVGRALVYATPEAAMLKFPFQVFQAAFGAAVSMLLCFKAGLLTFWDKFSQR